MRQRKKKWKAVPKLTPFEKNRVFQIQDLLRNGLDPFSVNASSGGGVTKYTYKDIANYIQYSHRPFDKEVSLFTLSASGKRVRSI